MNIDNPKPTPIIYDKRKYTFEPAKDRVDILIENFW